MFPGPKHIVQEYRIDDVRRPTQDAQFDNDKGQLKREKDTAAKGCQSKNVCQIGQWNGRRFFQLFVSGKGKQELPRVVQDAQGSVGYVELVTMRDQSEIGKHLSNRHGKYGAIMACHVVGYSGGGVSLGFMWMLCIESVSNKKIKCLV